MHKIGVYIMDKTLSTILSLIGNERGAKAKFSKALNLPSSALGDWQNGRNKSYLKKLSEIANYFNVSVDYLLGNEEKTPANTGERIISDDDIMFALWGDTTDVDEDDLDDVKRYAAFVRERKKKK